MGCFPGRPPILTLGKVPTAQSAIVCSKRLFASRKYKYQLLFLVFLIFGIFVFWVRLFFDFQNYAVGIREQKASITNARKVRVLHAMLDGIRTKLTDMDDEEKNLVARMIGNSIYDMRVVWSGYESKALIEARTLNKKTTKCPEHFFPRQVAGKRIVEHIVRFGGISLKKLQEFLDVFCQVHYTTSEENVRLKPYQKTDTFISAEHSYSMANIELIKVK